MELRILGPFQVFDDSGREVGLPTGRERVLLAALVLRRAEVVSVDEVGGDWHQVVTRFTIEVEDGEKPCFVGDSVTRVMAAS